MVTFNHVKTVVLSCVGAFLNGMWPFIPFHGGIAAYQHYKMFVGTSPALFVGLLHCVFVVCVTLRCIITVAAIKSLL